MSKRVLAILISVSAALLVLAVTIPRVFDSRDAIDTQPSGVTGVMRGVGGPHPGLHRLANVRIEIHRATRKGPIVAWTTSARNGRFKVTVAPGRYVVLPITNGDATVLPDSVTVRAGKYVVAKPLFSVR